MKFIPPVFLVIGGMMVHSVLKSQQIGQHIADGKPAQTNNGRCILYIAYLTLIIFLLRMFFPLINVLFIESLKWFLFFSLDVKTTFRQMWFWRQLYSDYNDYPIKWCLFYSVVSNSKANQNQMNNNNQVPKPPPKKSVSMRDEPMPDVARDV